MKLSDKTYIIYVYLVAKDSFDDLGETVKSSLHRLGDFETGLFVDLQNCVSEVGVEDMSLQKLYANFFGQRISKREQLTNWEADILSDKQKLYAATDAWSCIMLYEELMRLEQTGDYELIKVDKDETGTAA